jgi:hypothetical protein
LRRFTLVMNSFECSEEKAAELFVSSLHGKLYRDVRDSLGMKKERERFEVGLECASNMDNAADCGYVPARQDPCARKKPQPAPGHSTYAYHSCSRCPSACNACES